MSYDGWVMPAKVVVNTTHSGKGALGTWRTQKDTHAGHRAGLHGSTVLKVLSLAVNYVLRGVCERALKPPVRWEGCEGKCHDCQPDSGKPTVRDDRGACGNVGYGGIRNPLHIPKGCMSETLCLTLCAPQFYPDRQPMNDGEGLRTIIYLSE